MLKKRLIANSLLVLTALIWGVAFVAQNVAMDSIGTFSFNALRSLIAGAVLLPVVLIRKSRTEAAPPESRKKLFVGGILCGVIMFIASFFQQKGIELGASSGKAGFITALYIVFVPLMGLFTKKRPPAAVWLGVAFAVMGMYLLCLHGKTNGAIIENGDIFLLVCAVGFAAHIVVIDRFAPHVDGLQLSCIQFFVSGLLNLIMLPISESISLGAVMSAWLPILYAGVLSSCVGYTLQIVAQKNTRPAVASLIMSLESVFAALAGWLILKESMSTMELIGCGLVFLAVMLAQSDVFFAKDKGLPADKQG